MSIKIDTTAQHQQQASRQLIAHALKSSEGKNPPQNPQQLVSYPNWMYEATRRTTTPPGQVWDLLCSCLFATKMFTTSQDQVGLIWDQQTAGQDGR